MQTKKRKLVKAATKIIAEVEQQEHGLPDPIPPSSPIKQDVPTTTTPEILIPETTQEVPTEVHVPASINPSPMEIENPIVDQVPEDVEAGNTGINQENPTISGIETPITTPDENVEEQMRTSIEEELEEINISEKQRDTDETGENKEERESNIAESQETTSVKGSTSSAISDKELSAMKKKDPLAALRLMLSLSSSSANLVSSSSTTSLTSINQESTGGLLRQLKAKVLEGDLLARIGENSVESFEIKELLQKLHKSDPSQELLAFLVEFGPAFEALSLNARKREEALQQKQQETRLQQEKLDALKASQEKINDLEAQATENKETLADWDAKIQRFNEEIKILQSKLKNAEYQRSLVQEKMEAPTSKIQDEAIRAIQHFDDATQHQTTVAHLDKELNQLETSLAVSAKIIDRLKDVLKAL